MLPIHTSGVHPILFHTPSIWFHIALEHVRIINNDINSKGANYWICKKDRQVEYIYKSKLHYFSRNKS